MLVRLRMGLFGLLLVALGLGGIVPPLETGSHWSSRAKQEKYRTHYYPFTFVTLSPLRLKPGEVLKVKVECAWCEFSDEGFAEFLGFEGQIWRVKVFESKYPYTYDEEYTYEVEEMVSPLKFERVGEVKRYEEIEGHRTAFVAAETEWKANVPSGFYMVYVKAKLEIPRLRKGTGSDYTFFEVDASPPHVSMEIKESSIVIWNKREEISFKVDGREVILADSPWSVKWTPSSPRWFFGPHEVEIKVADDLGNKAKVGLSPTVFDPYSEEESMWGAILSYTLPYDGQVWVVVKDGRGRRVLKELVLKNW